MNRHDPRIRQTINRFTDTLESANLNTQASLWSFSESYVQPCLHSLSACLESACYPCLGAPRDRRRRQRQRHAALRGRPEFVFDFYNDEWEDDAGETRGLLGSWGADEWDQLLAGSGPSPRGSAGSGGGGPPRRPAPMSYGARTRRKSTGAKAAELDPAVVPSSSMFGFLERLPWRIGGRGRRYHPSAAGLQEHPGRRETDASPEAEALLSDDGDAADADEEEQRAAAAGRRGPTRPRGATHGSATTSNSLSSRGDLFPSEDEDDAVPLDDEFAVALERRSTTDEAGSGKASSRARRSTTSRTTTSSSRARRKRRRDSARSRETASEAGSRDKEGGGGDGGPRTSDVESAKMALEEGLPTMEDLKREEAAVREEEEGEVERKRTEARRVAMERGLSSEGRDERPPTSPPTSPPPIDGGLGKDAS